ncbi:hypothetical protein LDENG_00244700 [Lucifuga dentata]|nr:hypothetical protein LDENG_00244700 [Lucifuga dentata]
MKRFVNNICYSFIMEGSLKSICVGSYRSHHATQKGIIALCPTQGIYLTIIQNYCCCIMIF